ncbi:ATP-binding cassette domain-containing protein [Actinomadura oligospora]|uniref:ATP-binding cassette domain-containing protein n=1 Tax=Actinomadura oligospora TaxID=111804 RepID=UPI000478B094|nr:ATP-binding cassette domain-containing protein [Actinomadura oligospora]
MIKVDRLTKRYGDKVAVDGLTFTVKPGVVTGFLGPNGAGKTTTMRMILGIDTPTSGEATVAGGPYARLPRPMRTLGALLDARAVHPSRTARGHLLCLAASNGLRGSRVDEVLEQVGLQDVAGRRAGTFSLGMSQRLGIAAALLGDPGTLMFDEPVNGLDPEGIRWIRRLMRRLAAEGRTVLVSSHLMSEMALTADHLIVIGRGRLVADIGLDAFVEAASERSVLVRTPSPVRFADTLRTGGADVRPDEDGALVVSGMNGLEIGRLAAASGVPLAELTPRRTSLEEAFMRLTHDAVEYDVTEEASR